MTNCMIIEERLILRHGECVLRTFLSVFYNHRIIIISSVGVGAISGGIAAFISCPMEVCVVRLSNDSTLPPEQRRNYVSILPIVCEGLPFLLAMLLYS